ncbi:MAG TPA: hypothetical protein VHY55_10440 [Acidimicrobiia bacterium]|jgi:hypothetical protein|nr:hypothetical protein [Acidimicrobiia bacterium]
MDVAEFSRALEGLTADDVHRIAATLTSNHSDSAADEVEAWRVTLTIDRVLRRTHRTRLAARAASSITHTVLQIAAAQGIRLPDEEVTHVARAAAEVARGLIAGDDVRPEVGALLVDWSPLVAAPAA